MSAFLEKKNLFRKNKVFCSNLTVRVLLPDFFLPFFTFFFFFAVHSESSQATHSISGPEVCSIEQSTECFE